MNLLNNFLVNFFLFCIGLFGIILNRQSLIIILMSIELMLLSINLNFIIFSLYLDDVMGELFALLILTVAASESAIGLAIIIVFFRNRGTISINKISLLSL
jgi:NADH-quinone oxidoreductase subunit K